MANTKFKTEKRERRHRKIRSKISGTKDVPRLSVFRSNTVVYAQLIDDVSRRTVASSDTKTMKGKTVMERAVEMGKDIAKKAETLKVKKVAFDRGGFLYAGKIKAFADSARAAGLTF